MPILDDGPDDENASATFAVQLSNPTNATLADPSDATVTIWENPEVSGTAFAAIQDQSFTGSVATLLNPYHPPSDYMRPHPLGRRRRVRRHPPGQRRRHRQRGRHAHLHNASTVCRGRASHRQHLPATGVGITYGRVVSLIDDTRVQAACSSSLTYQANGSSGGSDANGNYDLGGDGTLDYQLQKTVYTPTGSGDDTRQRDLVVYGVGQRQRCAGPVHRGQFSAVRPTATMRSAVR